MTVTLASSHDATLSSLETYLRGAGVTSNGTRFVERLAEMTPPSATSVVVFPDDFPERVVEASLASLAKARPGVLLVVVTSEPSRFEDLLPGLPFRLPSILLPKPAWAWNILDAIRARLDGSV